MASGIVYVAGRYTGGTPAEVDGYIGQARQLMAELVRRGYTVICPHSNFAHFERILPEIPYGVWLEHCFRLINVCSAVVVHPNWVHSSGAKREVAYARGQGKAVYLSRHVDGAWAFRRLGEREWRSRL